MLLEIQWQTLLFETEGRPPQPRHPFRAITGLLSINSTGCLYSKIYPAMVARRRCLHPFQARNVRSYRIVRDTA
jgi:hypothetical protein